MLILHIWQCKENLIRPVLNIQIASPMVSVQTFGEVRTSRLQKSLLVRFPNLAEFIYVLLLHSEPLKPQSRITVVKKRETIFGELFRAWAFNVL